MKTPLHNKSGTIEVIEVDGEAVSEDECRAFAALQNLGPYEFEQLTGHPIGSDDLFVFDQNGVRSREYSDHELALLDPGSRREVLETLRHRLDFPCTPNQLLNFVDAVSWFFDAPEAFREVIERLGAGQRNSEEFGLGAFQASPLPINESGSARDKRIAERAKYFKASGYRNFLQRVATEESRSLTAIKDAIRRHKERIGSVGGGASMLSLSGQLKAANK
jgi:hypothetical protein